MNAFIGQSASVDSNDAMAPYKSRVFPSSPEAGLPPSFRPFHLGGGDRCRTTGYSRGPYRLVVPLISYPGSGHRRDLFPAATICNDRQ